MKFIFSFIIFVFLFYSVRSQQPELILPVGHTQDIYLTQFSNDGKYILTCAYDNTAKLGDAFSGRLLHTFSNLLQTPEHIINNGNTTLLSTDSKYLIALTTTGYLMKWYLPTAKLLFTVNVGNTNDIIMEYNADGRYILLKKGWYHYEIDAKIKMNTVQKQLNLALMENIFCCIPTARYIFIISPMDRWRVNWNIPKISDPPFSAVMENMFASFQSIPINYVYGG
jgi:hypothetical protein